MTISPIHARRAPTAAGERGRARLALATATVGIAAILLAYALSPGVRHAVGHAAHSVKHAVGHVLDPDHTAKKPANTHEAKKHGAKTQRHTTVTLHTSSPARASSSTRSASPAPASAP
jgi:hypothetical protein